MHDPETRFDRLEEAMLFAQRVGDEHADQLRMVFDRLSALERRLEGVEARVRAALEAGPQAAASADSPGIEALGEPPPGL